MANDWSNLTNDELMSALVDIDEKPSLDFVDEIVSRGEAIVERLGRVLTCEGDPYRTPGDAPSVAALHLLGLVGSPAAAPWILRWLRDEPDTDHATETARIVLGRLGPGAVDALAAGLEDESINPVLRGEIAAGLVGIGARDEESKVPVARAIASLIDRTAEQGGRGDNLIAWVVDSVGTVDAPEIRSSVLAAFERGDIDEGIIRRRDFEAAQGSERKWWLRDADLDLRTHFTEVDRLFARRLEESFPPLSVPVPSRTKSDAASKSKRKAQKKARRKNR